MGKKKETKTVFTKTPVDLQLKIDSTISTNVKMLSISASWSIVDEDHGDGQKLRYQTFDGVAEPPWTGTNAPPISENNPNKTETSKTFIERDLTNYYPASGKPKITWLHVEVIGKRKKYTKTTSKKTITYKTLWSNPAARTVHIVDPPDPELAEEVSAGTSDFSKRFSWTVPSPTVWIGVDYKEAVKRKSKKAIKKLKDKTKTVKSITYRDDDELIEVFYDTEWQSILIDNLAPGNENFDPTASSNESRWAPGSLGWQTGSTTPGETSSNQTITESHSTWTDNYSYTRYFRVRSRGLGGDSGWDYAMVNYYNAPAPSKPSSSSMDSEGNITMVDSEQENSTYPSKYISYQYLTDTPETSIAYNSSAKKWIVTVSPPQGSTSWVESMRVPGNKTNGQETKVTFPTAKPINDKLTWTRKAFVGTDDSQRNGEAAQVKSSAAAPLTPPTGIQISDIDTAQKRMKVSATNNSQVTSSYLLVWCRDAADNKHCVGLIPHGESEGITIQVPKDWSLDGTAVGVQAMLANYKYSEDDNGGKTYTTDPPIMQSEIVWDGGTLPTPPTGLKLEQGKSMGTILATWDWTWSDSNVAEISWSETQEAWESTSPPSTYTISDTHTGKWYITGLSVGEWYVRVRLGRTENDVTTWSSYGMTEGDQPIKIVSVPDRPHLMITPKVITPDKEVKLSWVYTSEDGASQRKVYIAKEGHLNEPIISENQSTVTLKQDSFREELRWEDGDIVKLQIRTESSEGKQSEWSYVTNDSTFNVAALPRRATVQFDSGWNPSKSVTVGTSTAPEACLVSLPFIFTIGNVDKGNDVVVKIIREVEDTVMKPDENQYPVYANDIVYLNTDLTGPGEITITQKDLIGTLDDEKYYKLIISNTDQYGQKPADDDLVVRFRVDWDHKAIKPLANIAVNREEDIAFIQPIQPTGYLAGDVCDIYRLSADKPEQIIEGATFGTWYADEFPTIGELGGYKVVYRTFNGDIRTANGGYADTDYEGEDFALTDFMSIIDFGKDSVILRYNLSLSNTWNKDFTETKYLGGAVQGDWNPAVSRTGSLKATVSIQEDPMNDNPEETIEAMRRLAVYAGICHIRTPDGSNYYANVDVQEDREEKWVTQLAKFSLNITKVDPPKVKYIMRTKAEWEADQEDEE